MTLPTITRAHRRRTLGVLALAALLLAAAAALVVLRPAWATSAAPTLRAVVVSCGQTITASIVVSNDLDDCPGYGLIVGANGITLDLGGHTIDGDSISGGRRRVERRLRQREDPGRHDHGVRLRGAPFVVRRRQQDHQHPRRLQHVRDRRRGRERGRDHHRRQRSRQQERLVVSEADGLQVANSTINGNGLVGI